MSAGNGQAKELKARVDAHEWELRVHEKKHQDSAAQNKRIMAALAELQAEATEQRRLLLAIAAKLEVDP